MTAGAEATGVLAPMAELDYYDSQSVELSRAVTPLEAWNRIMTHPMPLMSAAFRVRDVISALFGVKRVGGFSGERAESVKVGDHLDFFLVEGISSDALILSARDRHLDVMTALSVAGRRVTITASVVTHNAFGRAYMLPVGPAHRLIVWGMLKRLKAAADRGETTAAHA